MDNPEIIISIGSSCFLVIIAILVILYYYLAAPAVITPKDCVMHPWENDGDCTLNTNGSFLQKKIRSIKTKPIGTGTACTALTSSVVCTPTGIITGATDTTGATTGATPNADCVTSAYGNYGECTKNSSGVWQKKRSKTVTTAATGTGTCGVLDEYATCTPPNADCVMSNWSDYSICALNDSNLPKKKRTRTITTAATGTGAACGVTEESTECIIPLNTNCVMSNWVSEGTCAKGTNGLFYQQQTRSVTTPQSGTGTACPTLLKQGISCVPNADCVTSAYGDYGVCAKNSDGIWQKKRSKTVTTAATGTGTCGVLDEYATCEPKGQLCNEWNLCLASPDDTANNGDLIQNVSKSSEKGQIWTLLKSGHLCNEHGKCLASSQNFDYSENNLVQFDKLEEAGQKWAFTVNGNLCNQHKKCLAPLVEDGGIVKDKMYQRYESTTKPGQKWKFI